MRLSHKVFLDSNLLISAFDSTHDDFITANQILGRLQRQAYDKSLVISQYVLSETLAYITYKQKNDYHPIPLREEYVEKVSAFINSRYVDMIFATQEEASVAFDFVRCHPKIAASMADWISLILMVRQNIPVIQTYDRDFDVIKKEIPQFKDIIIWRR